MQKKVTPYLWFDNNAEEAMNLYTSIFPDSKISSVNRLPENTPGAEDGGVMMGIFEIFGQEFMVMNGGPQFKFNESISLYVECEDQAEVDMYWEKLTADGGEESMCGWLKDKFGLSWQIIPKQLGELMGDSDPEKAQRVMGAMLKMQKIVIADLERAHKGE